MSNDKVLKLILEISKNGCIEDSAEFQEFIKQLSISTPILVQAITDLFKAFANLFTNTVDFIAEQFNKFLKEFPADLSEVTSEATPHVKHFAKHSKKIRVRKKNYKRLWKRQKIP